MQNIDLKNCSTALFVSNIDISKNFYVNVLNIPVEMDFGKNIILKSGHTIWEIRDDHILSKAVGKDISDNLNTNRFELYFETDDIDLIFHQLKSNNVNFLHEIHEEIWGQRTIRFFDPDRHLIEVGESLYIFIKRFYDSGLDIEQISIKTFVPEDKVKIILQLTDL